MREGYEDMMWGELGPAILRIDEVKPVEPETELVDAEGVAQFLIVTPEGPTYRDLAYELREAIEGSLGGRTRVKAAADVTEEEREALNVIALGNINDNPLLGELYHSYYVAVDHAYPGRGGYVLQTVYDPWGHGTNAVVCGGSDIEGVADAVGKAIKGVIRRPSGAVCFPRLRDIAVGEDFKERYPSVAFECTPEHRRWMIEHTYERLEQGMHRGATPPVSHAGLMYHLTGDERFAELYRDLFKILYQDAVNDPGTGPWGPWGFDADFQSATMLQAWDVVEEAAIFSDEDRLYISNHLLQYVEYMAGHAKGHRPEELRSPRHNHYTFASLGLLYGGKYFQKYYGYPEAEDWLGLADECFQTQMEAFKANEDCNSYKWLTFYHTLKYALVRPDPIFIAEGNARLCLDLGIATMDNLGYQVPYGDCRNYTGTFSEVPYYKAVAWTLGDPAYRPVVSRKDRVKPAHDIDGIQPVGYQYEMDMDEGRALKRFFDVSALPVDTLYFNHFDGPEHIDYDRAFDKIVFRHSLDPEDDYLLLDGLSNGGHNHDDGNAILRYTSQGRIWLADADYMKKPQKFHNSLLVFKDGRGALLPPYTELGEVSWLEPFGYSQSTIRDHCGVDWTRHVLEVRGEYFLVWDEVCAVEAGEYDFRCLWRTVGETSLDEGRRTLTVDQEGPTFEIHCAPGYSAPVDMVLKEEPMIWGTWDEYPYHGRSADVDVLQERVSKRLEVGERYDFFNLFGTDGPYPGLERREERVVCVGEGKQSALVGSGEAMATDALETDASVVYASSSRAFLGGVSTLRIEGNKVLQSSVPLTLLLDFAEGRTVVHATDEGEVQLGGGRVTVGGGEQAISLPWLDEMKGAIKRALEEEAGAKERARARPEIAERMADREGGHLVWELVLPDEEIPYSACLGQPESHDSAPLYVGTEAGTVFRIDEGQITWSFDTEGRVNSIVASDVDGDGVPEVVVGSADHNVYLLEASGQEMWRRELPYYMHEPTVESVLIADFGLSVGRAVVAGSDNCHVHAFGPDGEELWRFEVNHGANALAAADMNDDGKEEVLAVTEWWRWHAIDADGEGLWPYGKVRPRHAPGANVVRGVDVSGDDVPAMICGAIDSCVYLFDEEGEKRWEFFTGEEISALRCLDLDGDGVAEIVAGSMNGYVYGLDGEGEELWHCGLEEEVNSLSPPGKDGKWLVAGTDGPLIFVLGFDGAVRSFVDTGDAQRVIRARGVSDGLGIYAVGRAGRVARYDLIDVDEM